LNTGNLWFEQPCWYQCSDVGSRSAEASSGSIFCTGTDLKCEITPSSLFQQYIEII
jgi:hypothetical protein